MDYCRAFLLFSGIGLCRGGGGGGCWGGGGGVADIARCRLRIPRYLQALARIKLESSEVVVFDGGGILCGSS